MACPSQSSSVLLQCPVIPLNSLTIAGSLKSLLCVFSEQQDSMATTVAVSPSEYLQPSSASTQVSSSHKPRLCTHVALLQSLLLLLLLTSVVFILLPYLCANIHCVFIFL